LNLEDNSNLPSGFAQYVKLLGLNRRIS